MGFDYRRDYELELSHRQNLHGSLGTPITIVSLLGAVVGAMLNRVRADSVGGEVIVFWVAATTAMLLLVKSVYHLARSLHGHTYSVIESPSRLRTHHAQLRTWHEEHGEGRLRGDREFEEYLENAYADATEHNRRINDFRTDQLFLGQRWMILAAVATGVSALPFLVNQQIREQPLERFVMVPQEPVDESAPKMTQQNPAKVVPPKPTPPPLRELREGHVPPPPRAPKPARPQR